MFSCCYQWGESSTLIIIFFLLHSRRGGGITSFLLMNMCSWGASTIFCVMCAGWKVALLSQRVVFFGWIEFCWQLKTRELLLCLLNDFHQALTKNQSFRESELNSSFYFPLFFLRDAIQPVTLFNLFPSTRQSTVNRRINFPAKLIIT